jgi:predicted acetyltransferase
MIAHSIEAYKPELKQMWKLCFEDSDEFIRFYFDKIYRNQESLVLLDKDHKIPLAFLQIIPYQIKIGKNIYEAGYISGAMTHPECRKKGYMQQLLNAAFSEMKKRNYTFTFLIPQEDWLFDFYVKSGYEKAFPKSRTEIDLTSDNKINFQSVKTFNDLSKIPTGKLYHLYSGFLMQKTNVVLKTQAQFALMLEDLFLDKGCVFYTENEGIALAAPFGDKIIIKEMFCSNEIAKQTLLNKVKTFFNSNQIILINNSSNKNEYFYGMIKLLIPSDLQEKIPEDVYMNMMLD